MYALLFKSRNPVPSYPKLNSRFNIKYPENLNLVFIHKISIMAIYRVEQYRSSRTDDFLVRSYSVAETGISVVAMAGYRLFFLFRLFSCNEKLFKFV